MQWPTLCEGVFLVGLLVARCYIGRLAPVHLLGHFTFRLPQHPKHDKKNYHEDDPNLPISRSTHANHFECLLSL